MWKVDHKGGWVTKKWCFWPVVLEKHPESSLDCKEIKPVNPKGNQKHWIFIGRIHAEVEAPILWPFDANSQLIRKRPWCWERLKAGGEGGDRGHKWLDGITDSMDMSLSKLQKMVKPGAWWREAWHAAVHGVAKSQIQLTEYDNDKSTANIVLNGEKLKSFSFKIR